MATLLDNFTDNLKTWTNSAANRASELTKAAAIKAEELGKVGRLKMEVYQLQRQRQRFLGDLGKVAYSLIKKNTAPDALAKSDGVDTLMKRLTDLNAKIDIKVAEIEAASDVADRRSGKSAPAKAIAVATSPAASKGQSSIAGSGKTAKTKTAKAKATARKPASKSPGKSSKTAAKKSKPRSKSAS